MDKNIAVLSAGNYRGSRKSFYSTCESSYYKSSLKKYPCSFTHEFHNLIISSIKEMLLDVLGNFATKYASEQYNTEQLETRISFLMGAFLRPMMVLCLSLCITESWCCILFVDVGKHPKPVAFRK